MLRRDSRTITWVHVRSHGRETDPAKQHLLPLMNELTALQKVAGLVSLVLICKDGSTP